MSEALRLTIQVEGVNWKADSCLLKEAKELWLDETGFCDMACAVARISYADGTLCVKATERVEVVLERMGRRKILGTQEIKLMAWDTLCFGEYKVEIGIEEVVAEPAKIPSIFKRMLEALRRAVMPEVKGNMARPDGWGWEDKDAWAQYDALNNLPDECKDGIREDQYVISEGGKHTNGQADKKLSVGADNCHPDREHKGIRMPRLNVVRHGKMISRSEDDD